MRMFLAVSLLLGVMLAAPAEDEDAAVRLALAKVWKIRLRPQLKALDEFEQEVNGKLSEKQQPLAAEAVKIGRVLANPPPTGVAPGDLPEDCYVTPVCSVCRNECELECRKCRGKGFTRELQKGKTVSVDCPVCKKTGKLPCPKKCVKEQITPMYNRFKAMAAHERRLAALFRSLHETETEEK